MLHHYPEGLGSVALSQAFALPEAGQRYLENLGLRWARIKDAQYTVATHDPGIISDPRGQQIIL